MPTCGGNKGIAKSSQNRLIVCPRSGLTPMARRHTLPDVNCLKIINAAKMVLTISINGADNAGKTTQIALLPFHRSVALIRSLHEYDETLGNLVKSGS